MENETRMEHGGAIFLILLILVILEIIWSWKNDKKVYETKDTLANLAIFAGFQMSKVFLFGFQYATMSYLAQFALLQLKINAWVFLISFIAVDFMYYWYHRYSHKIKFLWAFHLVHHSSLFMNLTVSYRLNWLSALLTPFVVAPLILIGLPFELVAVSFGLNLLYQFFLHTEAVGKLGFIEGILATPSAHRVHHGSNEDYIDKNFGGVLMIWDRMFGTYQPETEKPTYGITTGFISNNPLVLIFKGFYDYFKGKMDYKG
ncbi:sterol desaturase family protein [Flagellimonas zhangzhouensis]|uniref:Sterol desaturase/sphingolipid hydroxylase, fatty acid hydroxylase superfamily n=1 Tax=Flagellimonas zhangzhouensis TaxID=1073328 RepID=A0A1H2WXR2_9FLAO|nr:sterol desaturase family protein [Allomuricauda zhangzhouensis]SDQ25814.1 Sterol desaturase/sphingolipid hydroxylase, fatty acid hydroxylase superfamily [Allomuricauda zhangzhouensis]SDW85296.1 Sterol desaturase/sphingolipid hydroxylase, fatty acid hydroxylase superfamily [Allomuricauda zhangzhouensis]